MAINPSFRIKAPSLTGQGHWVQSLVETKQQPYRGTPQKCFLSKDSTSPQLQFPNDKPSAWKVSCADCIHTLPYRRSSGRAHKLQFSLSGMCSVWVQVCSAQKQGEASPKVSRQTGALQVSSSRGRQSTPAAGSESRELLVLLGDRCSWLALASCSLQGKHLPCLLPGSTEAFNSSREGPRSQICPSPLGFAFVWNCLEFFYWPCPRHPILKSILQPGSGIPHEETMLLSF